MPQPGGIAGLGSGFSATMASVASATANGGFGVSAAAAIVRTKGLQWVASRRIFNSNGMAQVGQEADLRQARIEAAEG
jgi:hypothetical protein